MASLDNDSREGGQTIYRRLILSVAGIAAGLLIIFGSWYFFMRYTDPRDTFSDPELAYAEVMKVLNDVSVRLNKGAGALESVGKMHEVTEKSFSTISRSTNKIGKNLETLDQFTRKLENMNLEND